MIRGYWHRLEDGKWGGRIPGDYELGETVEAILESQKKKLSKVVLEIIDTDNGEFELEGQRIGIGRVKSKERIKNRLGDYVNAPEETEDESRPNGYAVKDLSSMSFQELTQEAANCISEVKETHRVFAGKLKNLDSVISYLNFRTEQAIRKQEEQ